MRDREKSLRYHRRWYAAHREKDRERKRLARLRARRPADGKGEHYVVATRPDNSRVVLAAANGEAEANRLRELLAAHLTQYVKIVVERAAPLRAWERRQRGDDE